MSIKTIETKRLVLRPFMLEDVPAMFEHWAGRQDNVTHVTWQAHDNQEVTRKIISSWIKEERAGYHLSIVKKSHQTLIRNIAIVDHKEDTQTAEIGYILGKDFWNEGFMTEALKAVIASLFEKTAINRIQAVFDTENPASGKVMTKAGMSYEGTLRQASINNRGLVDIAIFAILKSDYLKEKTDDY
ncbi:GNAT family N-acetyltransferase [Streptococcus jiangjianxini]|uniref:GNAT family N-acetyltransferase n=1 Tax=Streptococcus jiangjianxini TaxID=3161189 RepID=UPI0032EFF22F